MTKFSLSFLGLAFAALFTNSVLAGPGAHGPNGEHLDAPTPSIATGLARLPDGSVNVPKLAQRRMTIRTVIAHEGEHPLTVELNGRVGIDPNAGGRVQAPFAGRIESGPKGLPVVGQSVEKGQVLLYVRPVAGAIERANQQAQLVEIQTNRRLVEQRVKRLEALEGTVPQKEIEAARAELSSLTGREKAVSVSVRGNEAITAPVSGVVASANALGGQVVEARDVPYEIVDLGRMLVEASTTDASLAGRVSAASLVNLPAVQLSLLGGGRSLRDGALPVTFRAKAGNTALAIGQPVTVVAKLTDKVKGIAIPAEAVVRNPSNEPIVWVKSGAERFEAYPVQTRPLDGATAVVIKGLAADSRVVVSGAPLINQIR